VWNADTPIRHRYDDFISVLEGQELDIAARFLELKVRRSESSVPNGIDRSPGRSSRVDCVACG
jgi:hypothetical protein